MTRSHSSLFKYNNLSKYKISVAASVPIPIDWHAYCNDKMNGHLQWDMAHLRMGVTGIAYVIESYDQWSS